MTFYNDVIEKSAYFNSRSRVSDIELLEPETRKAVESILKDAAEAGTPLMLYETYRSLHRQIMLFDQGTTKLRDVGAHHYGVAADLVKDNAGQPSWDGDFKFLGELAVKYGLVWGGDWGAPRHKHPFVDACHVQRVALSDQERLFAGAWYPDKDYQAVSKAVPEDGERKPAEVGRSVREQPSAATKS